MMDFLVPDLIGAAIPAFVGLLVIEAIVMAVQRDDDLVGFEGKDTAASLSMGLGNVFINLFWKGVVLAVYTALWRWSPLDHGFSVAAWIAVFFLEDLAYYAYHRVHHEVRFFWASHVVHHSSQRYNLSTALRQTWTPMTGIAFWAPLALLGFHPVMILVQMSISLLYQFWIHTEAIDRLPRPIELVFNTPSHHRVHHASNPQYLDKNYAGILIVWDRLFGTFEPEIERPVYGLTTNIATYNPVRIAFHEYAAILSDVRTARRWRDRLGYAMKGPGWRPVADLD
jgi:sterol desaturase/sphingolipid hydroxylase (fatty acid hydroxylase superfamily)